MRVLRYILGVGLAATVFLVATPPADAALFTFADSPSTAPEGAPPSCFNGDDVCGATLTWIVDSVELTASSEGTAPDGFGMAVIQDRFPDHGGLGVVYKENGEDKFDDDGDGDEIDSGQTLVLTFDQAVFLDSLTFFNRNHRSLASDKTFDFAVGTGSFDSTLFTADFSGTEASTYFSFRWGGDMETDFYVASIEVEPVPEPATLLLLGSGLAGLVVRRRRRT